MANGSSPSGPVPIQTEEVKPPEVLKRRGVEAPEMDALVGRHTRLLTSTFPVFRHQHPFSIFRLAFSDTNPALEVT